MDLDDLPGWAKFLAALFGGAGGLWGFLGIRAKLQAQAPADAAKAEADLAGAAADFATAFGKAAQGLVDDLRKELRFVRERLAGAEAEIVKLNDRASASEAHRVECERVLAEVRAEVDRLMRDQPPASY